MGQKPAYRVMMETGEGNSDNEALTGMAHELSLRALVLFLAGHLW